ncbi:acetyltransferase [Sphingobacteriaceae bacterium WQ 2009]|uniref:Acetyltransferase n=1 Tax=Rhinopithecimicrobium faecis TaxID=2820698 RepID=A0A8T4H765_9SPHI|nr:acetyltransferase [Sphingobacteriaceae bacterium WQ 2009]
MGLYLYGSGGHAKVVLEIAEVLKLNIEGFVDDYAENKFLFNYPIYSSNNSYRNEEWIIAIGDNSIRKKIANKLSGTFPTLIHPSANISKRCLVNEGTVIMAGVTVNSSVIIGRHVILNTNSSIDHDCIIEDYVHVSPNVAIAGNVKVGECTHLGIGCCIIQGVSVGRNCIVGAGAVVIRDVPDGTKVVGNPSKKI